MLCRASTCLGTGGDECTTAGKGEYILDSFGTAFSNTRYVTSSTDPISDAAIVASDDSSGRRGINVACDDDG